MNVASAKPSVPIRAIVVALLALAAVQALFLIPILGLDLRHESVQRDGISNSMSVAAIALSAWLPAVAMVQIVILALPERWGRLLGQGGFADPFGWAALGLSALFAYSQAKGVAISMQTINLIATGAQGRASAIGSLMVGAAAVIACGGLIERFAFKGGFWLVLSSTILLDLPTVVRQFAEHFEIRGPVGLQDLAVPLTFLAFGPGTVLLAVFLTLAVLRRGGRMDVVAWPLLLTPVALGPLLDVAGAVFDVDPGLKGMPENLVVLMALTLLLVGLFGFLLTRRAGLPGLALPLIAVLGLIASAEVWLTSWVFWWPFPFAAGMLVALAAVLTALVWRWRQTRRAFAQT